MELGARIAHWRAYRNLSQSVLAKAAGVSVSAVSLWERPLKRGLGSDGKPLKNSRPSHEHLPLVAKALGVTMSQFYGPLPKIPKGKKAA